MRALVIDKAGSIDRLRMAEVPVAEPAAGEIRIRVAAVGINPADWKILERGWPTWAFPKVAGLDGAGIVDALGAGVIGFRPGQRVYWHGRFARLGAFAELACIDADILCEVPAALSLEAAAALPTAAFTAYQIVERKLRLAPGDTALVNAAAGGVGLYVMQLLRRRGVRVIAVCAGGNDAFVRRFGAQDVIDYRKSDIATTVRTLTGGRGADAIIDPMGPDSSGRMLAVLAYGGQIACVTGVPRPEALAEFPRGRSLHDIALGWAYLVDDPRAVDDVRAIGAEVARMAAMGELQVPLEARVSFEALPQALAENKAGHQRGRVVAIVDGTID